jgi:hypothetical protein
VFADNDDVNHNDEVFCFSFWEGMAVL